MELEQEDEGRVPTRVLLGIGVFMLLLGAVLASVFIFRLQPPLAPSQAPPPPQAGIASVVMPNGVGTNTALDFSPKNITVVVGVNNTVVWTNDDISGHTVTSKQIPTGAASFSSQILTKGETFNVTLTVPGTYDYFCSLHPLWMQATIIVKAGSSSTAASGVTVTMPAGVGSSNTLNYSPPSITIVIGVNNTVTWVNKDQAIHTVTATDNSFNSGNISPGSSYTYTFTTPGTYTYSCIYHSWMKGTVVVKSSGSGAATP